MPPHFTKAEPNMEDLRPFTHGGIVKQNGRGGGTQWRIHGTVIAIVWLEYRTAWPAKQEISPYFGGWAVV